MIIDNKEKVVIPELEYKLKSGDITIEKYIIEIFKLKTKVPDMVKKIDGLRESVKE